VKTKRTHASSKYKVAKSSGTKQKSK